MRRTVPLLVVIVLLLVSCGGGAKRDPAAPSLPTPTVAGTIAFAKVDNHGRGDIHVIRTDGTGLKRLAASGDVEVEPAWSPDGGKIAYSVGVHRSVSVRVMNADGSGQVALTDGTGDFYPAWSPDGTRIAFSRWYVGIHIVNADGSGPTQVSSGASDRYPTWAPDGRIFFISGTEGSPSSDVYSVEPDGSGLAPVTRVGHVEAFSLSPDGRQLVIHDTANDRLALVPSSGQGTLFVLVEEVSQYAEGHVWSTWSPTAVR